MMDKILCAIDGSKAAERAVAFGVSLARKCDAELRFVTVSTVSQASAAESPFWDTRLFNAGEALIEQELSSAMSAAKSQSVKASCATLSGRDIAQAIVAYAMAEGFDHIVMGSTGHSAFGRLLTGSVVDDVLARQHPPVTVV